MRNAEPLLPAPADLGLVLAKGTGTAGREDRPGVEAIVRYRLVEAEEKQGRWSHPLGLLRPYLSTADGWQKWEDAGSEPRAAIGWFLTPAGLAAWRRGGTPGPGDLVHYSELWYDEARTGVGLQEDRRSGKEGQLYTFGFIRLHPGVGIGFEIRGTGLQPAGRVRLGGEGRTAVLKEGPPFPALQPELAQTPGRRFTLAFASAALSGTGSYPPGFSADRLDSALGGLSCRLLSAAVPGNVAVGGWDLASGRAKPLRRAIPAGSVFLFEATGGEDSFAFDGACLSDFPEDGLAQQGFGLAVAGLSP